MSPLEQPELDQLSAEILQDLSQTAYACASLIPLSGGTCNFVFRGALAQPLSIGRDDVKLTKSVIVKHTTNFVSANRNFPLDASRCIFEESMLEALDSLKPSSTPHQFTIKTPRLYLFNRETNTQVHEDFTDTTDLKSVFISQNANDIRSQSVATSIGHALGAWTRSFHSWASAPAQAQLRTEIANNKLMRELKLKITYDSFVGVLEKFPDILGHNREVLEEVKASALGEFGGPVANIGGDYWGIIHGDFWAGNVLVPNALLPKLEAINLVVIDWELAQIGHRAYDLGQMLGDLYERKHFKNVDGAVWAIEGFLEGYGPLDDDFAFRTAIHTGVHVLGWYNRRNPAAALRGTPEQIQSFVTFGRDLILKGWEKDKKWFEHSVFASLFQNS
ncbi:uncharacterized protein PAC_19104 [Phialocephala subalpina]|uniref:Aminoglycoside phosphotransferase domain-containing protein n=1 Tax=Phialocephala subalpina TaxID=576137 RepID=A0A1L7XVY7_9HELO|nr:uncharacterized protein PAC_19104 [Phialocephala subalpina]